MIIRTNAMLKKREKVIIIIVSIVIDIIIASFSIVYAILSIAANNSNIATNVIIIFQSLLGLISFSDLFCIIKKQNAIMLRIVAHIRNKKNYSLVSSINMNNIQKGIFEEVLGLEEKKKYIYIYGKTDKGKTTTILNLLEPLFLMELKNLNPRWNNNITFIDCTNRKNDILDFFNMRNPLKNRIDEFKDQLVVIDNIESLGDTFFLENISLFSSNKSFFIIIEDVANDSKLNNKCKIENALLVRNFNNSIIGVREKIDMLGFAKKLDYKSREIFFSLYISSLSSSYINVQEIRKTLNLSKCKFNKSLKEISKSTIFLPFPFNKDYYFFKKKCYFPNIEIKDDAAYKSALKKFLSSDVLEPEIRWLSLIKSDLAIIASKSSQERRSIFNESLKGGNYCELYNQLKKEITAYPDKKTFFLYEVAFLSFYAGNHQEAIELFLSLLNAPDINMDKSELMLHIIESGHGNPEENITKMISNFITILENKDDFYSYCARYWNMHIMSEQGVFVPEKFSEIRNTILSCQHIINKSLYNSILQRSYTDEIRTYHILGISPPYLLYSQYYEFLKKGAKSREDYFYNLYVEANDAHYISLTEAVLNEQSECELYEIITNAIYYYNKALDSSYNDEKSRIATRVKLIDVQLMYADFDYDESLREVINFKTHAQINNVGVHEAFCETLLIKIKSLNPLNISNENGISITDANYEELLIHFQNGRSIYLDFHNQYGVFRLDFLITIIKAFFEKIDYDICATKLIELKNNNIDYKKEIAIIEKFLLRFQEKNLSKAFLLSLIRMYPIILQ